MVAWFRGMMVKMGRNGRIREAEVARLADGLDVGPG